MLDTLSTMDRVSNWSQNENTTCVLCKNDSESRNHLFFECSYSSQICEHLSLGILRSSFSTVCSVIVPLLLDGNMVRLRLFCIRYAFQAAVYEIWRERNKIKHGEKPLPIPVLKKTIEKWIRNKLSLIRMERGRGVEEALQFWFETRV